MTGYDYAVCLGTCAQGQDGVSVTIVGAGAVLDLSGISPVYPTKTYFFTIQPGASLTLQDITLQNGKYVSADQ
jgi:hypothetical protein